MNLSCSLSAYSYKAIAVTNYGLRCKALKRTLMVFVCLNLFTIFFLVLVIVTSFRLSDLSLLAFPNHLFLEFCVLRSSASILVSHISFPLKTFLVFFYFLVHILYRIVSSVVKVQRRENALNLRWWFWAPCCIIRKLKVEEHFWTKTRDGATAFIPRVPPYFNHCVSYRKVMYRSWWIRELTAITHFQCSSVHS